MHDTARCLGYPSDSTRAARERAQETTSGSHLDRDGQAGWAGRHLVRPPLHLLSPPRLNSRHRGSSLRPCGSTLSHLAGVGG